MRSALVAAAMILSGLAAGPAAAQSNPDIWPDLVGDVFGDRPIEDGAGIISLEAPARAEDAAIVPMTIRSELPAGSPLRIEKVTLVIDQNPSPVAAEFSFGDAGTITALETRVRVNAYTKVHAVAEASDGKLYMAEAYVKASGGCSSPGLKVADASRIGEMKLRRFAGDPAQGLSDAQIMIRHPNNSGLQRDPIQSYYIPAFFIQHLTVTVGGKLLFGMEGGISISENPTFRLTYSAPDGAVAADAIDTDGHEYKASWPAAGGAS